ncbi:MAG: hypothetical protein WBC33_07820 [Conexibacter sp.]
MTAAEYAALAVKLAIAAVGMFCFAFVLGAVCLRLFPDDRRW